MNLIQRAVVLVVAVVMSMNISACKKTVQPQKEEPLKRPSESFLTYGETNETIIELNKVNNSVWMHTSYYEENGELIPLNGLITVTDKGLVLIDTPWTEQQLASLDALIKEAFNGSLKGAIITRTYPVGMKALTYLKNNKIPVYSLEPVAQAAQKMGFIMPDEPNAGEFTELEIEQEKFELYYPGEGYTSDNTVVWMDKYKLLYAGGLVVEYGAGSLGEEADINTSNWKESIKAIQERYEDIEIVIPAQGQWGDTSLIDYTLELLDE